MSTETYIKIWLEGKIDHLKGLIREEAYHIQNANGPDGTMFANMGNTETLKYHSQIKVLRELQEFLEGLENHKEI
jgi:hypothetical protein